MASVSELIEAANYQKSPLIKLLEGAAGGVANQQNHFYENAVRMVAVQKQQQDMQMAQAVEQRKAQQRAKAAADEQAIQQGLRTVGIKPSPVMPAQKITKVVDEEGNVASSYTTENDMESRLVGEVDAGMPIADAYAMKNRSGGGISNELFYRMGQDQLKATKELKAKEIPGYTRTGAVEVDDIETRKLREGVPEFETFKTAVSDYKKLISKHGTQEMTDRRVQGSMSALAKNLQLKVKNLAQLGVLSASDVPFIEEQIPSPGVFKTKEGMLGALETAEKLMQTAIDNKMKVGGYEAAGSKAKGSGVQAGAVEDGYRFKGGDPADPSNWVKQ